MMSDVSLASAPIEPADLRGLHYPLGRFIPEGGGLHEVAPGVFWLRMPIPFALDHINLWVLDDGNGWAIVDTGVQTPAGKDIWRAALAGPLAGKPVTRVIVTHYHPDHIGLAGWLCKKFGVPLEIARSEFMLAKVLVLDAQPVPPLEVVSFYARAGWPDERVAQFAENSWGHFGMGVAPLPTGYIRLQDGDVLTIGGRKWRIVTGRGHSPEHSCLVCEDASFGAGLMIAGDQVLPRITPNVSVYPTEPRADPLADWLASIERLRSLSPDLLVLPAHNEPFERLHTRLDQLRDDHMDKLHKLAAFCAAPRTVFETFEILFRRKIGTGEMMMASGEATAHVHWLEARGEVTRISDGRVDRFVRA
jgi:glyoxylase-like metal-dependent hydrolase (beta-lactamase superfamily II)